MFNNVIDQKKVRAKYKRNLTCIQRNRLLLAIGENAGLRLLRHTDFFFKPRSYVIFYSVCDDELASTFSISHPNQNFHLQFHLRADWNSQRKHRGSTHHRTPQEVPCPCSRVSEPSCSTGKMCTTLGR